MIYGLYSVRDTKTGFLPPQADQNNDSAIRNFMHACMQKDSLMYTHGTDFELYKIGEYDTESGIINPCNPCEFLANGTNKEM